MESSIISEQTPNEDDEKIMNQSFILEENERESFFKLNNVQR